MGKVVHGHDNLAPVPNAIVHVPGKEAIFIASPWQQITTLQPQIIKHVFRTLVFHSLTPWKE
jgi:hypothetical protein